MKSRYVAIDIESTGRNPERHQVLELAAVIETDWVTPVAHLPCFRAVVCHDEIVGEAFALNMNARLLAELASPKREHVPVDYLAGEFFGFLRRHFGEEHVTFAGKNIAAFDLRFLERLPGWSAVKYRRRVLDVGVLWFDPATDAEVPDTAECLRRAGLSNDRPHEAVSDCEAVVSLVREAYRRRVSAERLAGAFK